jgi:hypothetical protein
MSLTVFHQKPLSFQFRLTDLCLYDCTHFFFLGVNRNKNGTRMCGEGCGRDLVRDSESSSTTTRPADIIKFMTYHGQRNLGFYFLLVIHA